MRAWCKTIPDLKLFKNSPNFYFFTPKNIFCLENRKFRNGLIFFFIFCPLKIPLTKKKYVFFPDLPTRIFLKHVLEEEEVNYFFWPNTNHMSLQMTCPYTFDLYFLWYSLCALYTICMFGVFLYDTVDVIFSIIGLAVWSLSNKNRLKKNPQKYQ